MIEHPAIAKHKLPKLTSSTLAIISPPMNFLRSFLAYVIRFLQLLPFGGLKQNIFTDMLSFAIAKEQKAKAPTLRPQHPKSHGLLHGQFIVRDGLSDRCKFGVFATPKTYPIWVRFSNGSSPQAHGALNPDTEGDVRGMAIKLMEVKGSKLLPDEPHTQDFILANYPTFFMRDVQDYLDFAMLKSQGDRPNPELAQKLAPSFAMLAKINAQKVGNPLQITYWSTTPYKLGSTPIKFLVKPHQPELPPDPMPTRPNYLREAIVNYFSNTESSVKFDFQIQFYVDETKTPVENPMQEWSEADAVPITVATVEIPKQAFDFDARKQLDARLSFNPWHSLPDHEPLGSINLSRRKIYKEGAKHRRESMQVSSQEPQPYSIVHDDPQPQ